MAFTNCCQHKVTIVPSSRSPSLDLIICLGLTSAFPSINYLTIARLGRQSLSAQGASPDYFTPTDLSFDLAFLLTLFYHQTLTAGHHGPHTRPL